MVGKTDFGQTGLATQKLPNSYAPPEGIDAQGEQRIQGIDDKNAKERASAPPKNRMVDGCVR